MTTTPDKLRNICVVAHGGAGKTTLAGAMLMASGAVKDAGRVDDGTSVLDTDPSERRRGLTISAKVNHYDHAGFRVNLIDTPGYTNFLTEARAALRVSGGAVVILSAISGVKVQTERIWRFADEFEVSRVAFVNKLDRDRASFLRAVDDMERVLGARGMPVQLPVGEGQDFRGVIDLLTMKAHIYTDDTGRFKTTEVPEYLAGEARRLRELMVETLVEADDDLTARYLDGAEITTEELAGAMREAVLTRRVIPVFAGSALRNIGVSELLEGVNACLPSPLDKGSTRGHVRGTDPATGTEVTRAPDPAGPFSAFVFKTVIDPYTGRLNVFRVYSGTLRANSTVLNTGRGVKEKVAHIYRVEGDRLAEVGEVGAGDMAATSKLKDTHTGDTLSDPDQPVLFPPFKPLAPSLSYAIHPKTKSDEDKAPEAIARLMEEDPSLEFHRDPETNEFILSGVGQVHLEVATERLREKYSCDVELTSPRVPYKETIKGAARVQGKYKKQSGGHGQYGDAWLELSPLDRGGGFEFIDRVTGGAIPRQFIPAVEKGVKEAMASGVLAGFPVVDVKAVVYDGSHHSVDSSEMAFKIAASMGFRSGMEQADPVLLEPVMSMEIIVPEDKLGDIIGDINARRGKVLGAEPSAGSQTVTALVPMAEVLSYATDLRSMTGDRGIFTMEFSHYEEVPTHLSRKIVEAARAEKAESGARR